MNIEGALDEISPFLPKSSGADCAHRPLILKRQTSKHLPPNTSSVLAMQTKSAECESRMSAAHSQIASYSSVLQYKNTFNVGNQLWNHGHTSDSSLSISTESGKQNKKKEAMKINLNTYPISGALSPEEEFQQIEQRIYKPEVAQHISSSKKAFHTYGVATHPGMQFEGESPGTNKFYTHHVAHSSMGKENRGFFILERLDRSHTEQSLNTSDVYHLLAQGKPGILPKVQISLQTTMPSTCPDAGKQFNDAECTSFETGLTGDKLDGVSWIGLMDAQNLLSSTNFRNFTVRGFERSRPPYSYMALIQFAINSSPAKRMTLRQIYCWIEETFPYFKHARPGWKNSIRHNLSLHDIFIREVSMTSKASYWTLRADLNDRPLTLECARKNDMQCKLQANCHEGVNHLIKYARFDQTSNNHHALHPCIFCPFSLQIPPQQQNVPLAPNAERLEGDMQPAASRLPSCDSRPVVAASQHPLNVPPHLKKPVESVTSEKIKRKRPRKQPLRMLNDSLNDSLHFTDQSPGKSHTSHVPGTEDKALNHVTSTDSPSIYSTSKCSLLSRESGISLGVPVAKAKPISNELDQDFSSHDFNMPMKPNIECPSHCTEEPQLSHAQSRDSHLAKKRPARTESETRVKSEEYLIEECFPYMFGDEDFALNSSFTKFLDANGTSLLNLSGWSIELPPIENTSTDQ